MEERIEFIKEYIDCPWHNTIYNLPATDSQIEEFEKAENVIIPDDYKEFLKITNGALLFDGALRLYSVNRDEKYKIDYNYLGEGKIEKELLIVGIHLIYPLCYDSWRKKYLFYDDFEYRFDESYYYSDIYEVIDDFIDWKIR